MDPSSISSPLAPSPIPAPSPATTTPVPFTAEPNSHIPGATSGSQSNHPPYAEMIYTAIEALKEKNGSSKRAIGKYIEQVYKEQLPSTHDALLTHHLKRLKNNGMLLMVKKSYKLPRSAIADAATVAAISAGATVASGSPTSRPRGRPRKVQTPGDDAQAQNLPPPQQVPVGDGGNTNNNVQQQNAEPVWAALGLSDEPVAVQLPSAEGSKRGPGRPRKSFVSGEVGQSSSGPLSPGRRGRPPGSKSKKKPGRPPKSVTPVAGTLSGGSKRRPGRPPKNQQPLATPIPFALPTPLAGEAAPAEQSVGGTALTTAAAAGGSRPRGRPRKNAAAAVAAAIVAVGRGRGRGRGRGGGGRGRGRGRGGLAAQPKIGKRPVGRPRKGTTSPVTAQNAVNEDLKRKLDHFQTKVKESLSVLKPHFNHESPVTAIAAIQELEVLGTMDLNAPFKDETLPQQQQLPPPEPPQQQLPPQQQQQQQLPPQQHAYQQQFPQFHLNQYPQQYQQQHQQPQIYQQQPVPQQQQQFHP